MGEITIYSFCGHADEKTYVTDCDGDATVTISEEEYENKLNSTNENYNLFFLWSC